MDEQFTSMFTNCDGYGGSQRSRPITGRAQALVAAFTARNQAPRNEQVIMSLGSLLGGSCCGPALRPVVVKEGPG